MKEELSNLIRQYLAANKKARDNESEDELVPAPSLEGFAEWLEEEA
jgi:hypothetical protein